MTKRMLIDAAHAEETRVAVIDGTRIEELDFEIASKRQLRGNIYLAKVIRVEPSLQAAFVEYGGNRHGFLAFNEIHPDYFQIPQADREALLRDVADDRHDDEDDDEPDVRAGGDDEDDAIEQELERRRRRLMRKYKIQEVIRRRQIMLVQVVKEERGNKGAALTTYLSLAGRYCVLMPNTARGGGISRKITNTSDRKRLKSAANALEVPQGMGLIIRTAGAARTKAEIKRDYDYLLRMWENIRETTLNSIAPALIYAEEDLVKRAVRDMFDKDFDSIQVEGEAGWREARDFMRLIMPSQAAKVIHYKDPTPLFVRHRVEDQLVQIHSPIVPLRSGGYLVINQTEALVAIDVNSGRATRERNIEQTALKTNSEAAEETARQLRLRDLAGLIVIDFIDMDESKNNRAVEKILKDCLKDDRARVQMGKISGFGLMEISRQRRRMGVLEGSTHVCEHCHGAGRVRSVESSALAAMRAVELEAVKSGGGAVTLRLPTSVGLYVLNCKRAYLARVEETHGLVVTVAFDDALANAEQQIERTETREGGGQVLDLEPPKVVSVVVDDADSFDEDDEPSAAREDEDDEDEEDIDDLEAEIVDVAPVSSATDADSSGRRRRRRGRGRPHGSDEGHTSDDSAAEPGDGDDDAEDAVSIRSSSQEETDAETRGRRRRRGRRGGRRMREEAAEPEAYAWTTGGHATHEAAADPYLWHDPHSIRGGEAIVRTVEPSITAADDLAVVEASIDAANKPAAGPQVAAEPGADPYVWRDEEAGRTAANDRPKPRRSRGGRGRGRLRTSTSDPNSREDAAAVDGASTALDEDPAASAEASESSISAEAWVFVETAPPITDEVSGDQDVGASGVPDEAANVAASPTAEATAPSPADQSPPPADAADTEITASEPAPAAVIASALVEAPPPAEAIPDPAEISSPPVAPKRGWWRRG